MGYALSRIALSPLLLAQGRHVRRVTPRLPEPSGSREGVAGAGTPLSLLILGDSAAAGVGVTEQSQALSGQLVSVLSHTISVSWRLVAKSGLIAQRILEKIEALPPERFDVVVVSSGVNEVTTGTGLDQWNSTQQRLIEVLGGKFEAKHILLSSLPPMHSFPALPQPLRWHLGMRARRLNHALRELAARHERCEFVATEFSLTPDMMASDGFHPAELTYSLWSAQLATIALRRLRQP